MWGEPEFLNSVRRETVISTHSPRVGRTSIDVRKACNFSHFNSLAPCGANLCSDPKSLRGCSFQLTRPVWGEPPCQDISTAGKQFQLTRPVWGEPCGNRPHAIRRGIFQLTRPVWGEPRLGGALSPVVFWIFQLTRPVWGEPCGQHVTDEKTHISTHSPRVGRTHNRSVPHNVVVDFNSLAPCGANLYILYICRPFTSTWGGQ